MKLNKLLVNRLPGMPGGFKMETDATVSVIIGPNGSGKSSLTRAVRHLLWSDYNPGTPFSVEAFFTWEGASWKAVREEGMQTRWMREGQQVEAPDLPGDHVARCYELGLLDLVLPAGGEVEQQLAGVINKEMSGGVNLAQIAEDVFSFGKRTASTRNSQLKDATNALNNLVRQQKQLFEQESELVDRQRELDRINNAAVVSSLLTHLKARNEKLIDLEAVRARIDTFATGQGMVRREDNQTLASLNKQYQDKNRQAQLAGTERAIRQEQLKALDLPDEMTDCGLLARQVANAVKLRDDIQNLQENLVVQETHLNQTLMEFDPDADGAAAGPQPGRNIYKEVSKAYCRMAELQALTEGLDALLALPELLVQDPDPKTTAAVDKLRLWLETPLAGSNSSAVSALLASLVTITTGWLLWSSNENITGVAAVVLGAALAGYTAWRLLQNQSHKKQHKNLSDEITTLCSTAGIALDHPLQQRQIQRLVDDETRSEASRRNRQTLRDNLTGQHQRQNQKMEQSHEILESLRSEHGLALDRETPDLINLLNVIPRYRTARDGVVALSAAIDEKQKELDTILKACGSILTGLGFAFPASLTEAEQLLEDLESRLSQRQNLQDEAQRYQDELHRLQLDLEEIDGNLSAFWNRLGLAPQKDDYLVRNLVDQLSNWDEAVTEESNLKQQVDLQDREFRSRPELLNPIEAENLTDEQLDIRLENLRSDTEARDGIRDGITRIELQVEQARSSLQVAEARALQETARNALLETREQERHSTLGRLLLDDVQQTYHHASRPKVLARASDNFRDFTQGRYELQVIPGEDQNGRFAASDLEKKENLGLAELSDGTRAQLLLAVRLAFIAVNEGAAKPPIFLDESLTSSDPERFAAIADKLAAWAGSQHRQVFYLSSNPNDARAWESSLNNAGLPAPVVFDLARARKLNAGQPTSFEFEMPSDPPAPEQMSAAEYAHLMLIPGLNPWGQNTETHLWYILQDDLPQLHRLLLASANTLGKFLSRKDELLVVGKMSPRKLLNLEARGHCLDAFFKNWRIGRNRPVTAETLISSTAVGPTFMDKCRDLLDEVEGDSVKFLAGLRGKKVKRFAGKNIENLENYFLQEGFMDPRDLLTEEDLLSNVYSVVQSEIKAGSLEVIEVRTLVLSWWGMLKAAQ